MLAHDAGLPILPPPRVRAHDTPQTRARAAYFAARSCNTATAGSDLPSRNSRKAPPPVEM